MRELLLFCLLIVLAKVCQPFSFQSSNSVTKVATSNVNSNIFVWKSNWNVHYVNVGSSGPPLLLVPGFGVGTFHYDHQLEELSKQYRVFSFDLLGQGQSWPQDGIVKEDDSLCYSADLWLEQVIYFIETVIKEPVHIAGNSLGGYLALATASKRPDLIKSLVLLNAAPFWSFAAPREESGAIRPSLLLPWNGVLPAPRWILDFGSRYFDLMRDPKNVNTMLKTVYATPTGFDQELIDNILTSANRPGGQEAFTSILFSPKMRESFDEMLGKVSCPVCLIYGKEDPWIVPYWGQRAKKIKPSCLYFELSPSGHCPHHETPVATNSVLTAWIDEIETAGPNLLLQGQGSEISPSSDEESRMLDVANAVSRRVVGEYEEPKTGIKVDVSLVEGKPRTLLERIAAAFTS